MSVHIAIGALFGDEGKGSTVNYLCIQNDAKWVIRYNGGPQAGHNVVFPKGFHHCFSQLGSGSFVGANTFLSKYMMINPISLVNEAKAFVEEAGLPNNVSDFLKEFVFIDGNAPVILEPHIKANRILAKRTGHGTCAKGIGELAKDLLYHPEQVVRAKDLSNKDLLMHRLEQIYIRKMEELGEEIKLEGNPFYGLVKFYENFASKMNIMDENFFSVVLKDDVVFEPSQGVLLDEWHGFHPYTTWSNTTQENAIKLLEEYDYHGEYEVTGIIRAFMTRHGPGPLMESEPYDHYHEHNTENEWQGRFRWGHLDAQMLKYSFDCIRSHGKIDNISLTHMDVLSVRPFLECILNYKDKHGNNWELDFQDFHDVDKQEQITDKLMTSRIGSNNMLLSKKDIINFIEEHTGVRVKYISKGPYYTNFEKIYKKVS